MSVDLGTLQQRGQEGNSGDYLPPAFGGRELSRSESEAPARKGRFGLRSLDLQVRGLLCTALVTAVMASAGQQRMSCKRAGMAAPCERRIALLAAALRCEAADH